MFQKLLTKIAQKLNSFQLPSMVIGGQAVLLYGEPRLTKDIDIKEFDLALGTNFLNSFKRIKSNL